MSYGLIDENTLENISDAIREKCNSTSNYYPREMATAIRSIQSGGGFPEPVVYSISPYAYNNQDNKIIDRYNLIGFETTNELPNEAEILDQYAEWEGISPGQVVFYRRWQNNIECPRVLYDEQTSNYYIGNVNNVNGWFYGLCVDNTFTANQASMIDIHQLAYYCYNYSFPWCGEYTTSMEGAYMYCYNVLEAVCGPHVVDMRNAYSGCSNLQNAYVGDNVKYMVGAFESCSNIKNAVFGPNVINIANSYAYCGNLTGVVTIPDTVKNMNYAFYNDYKVGLFNGSYSEVEEAYYAFHNCRYSQFNNIHLNSLKDGRGMFLNCAYLEEVDHLESITQAYEMFKNCYNLSSIPHADYGNLLNAGNMFYNTNISQSDCDFFIQSVGSNVNNFVNNYDVNLANAFGNCQQITNMYVTNRFNYDNSHFQGIFMGCPIENVVIDEDVNSISYVFSGFNVTEALCPDSVVNMVSAYYNCHHIMEAYAGPNVINMSSAFRNCSNLETVYFSQPAVDIGYAFDNCYNASGSAIIYENVNRITYCLNNCSNIIGIAIFANNLIKTQYQIANAFSRSNNYLRRNVITTNNETFNALVTTSYQAFGSGVYFQSMTVTDPINVIINGITYEAVRCSYNTSINTYVYCTE